MNGDLSLSQALGGLRIANPDSDDDDDVPEKVPRIIEEAAAAAAAETRIPAAEPAPSLEPVPRPQSRPEPTDTSTTAATAAVASSGGGREEETLLLPHGPGADTQSPSAQPFSRADGFQHRPPPPPSHHHYAHHQHQHQRQRQHQHQYQYQHHLHLHHQHQHQHHFRERDGDQSPYSPYPFIPTGTPDTAARPSVSDSLDPRLFRPQHSDPTLAPAHPQQQHQQQLRRAHSARLSPTIPLDHATGGPADHGQIGGGGGGGAWSSSSSVAGSRSAAIAVTKTGSFPHHAVGLSRTESRAGSAYAGSAYASPAISREPSQRLRMNNSNRQGAGAGTAAAAAAPVAALPSSGGSAPSSRGRISRGMTTGYMAQSQQSVQSVQSQHQSHLSHQSHQSQQLSTYVASSSSSATVTAAPTSSEDWKDRGAAVGVRKEVDANGRMVMRTVKKGVRDFSFGRVLGEGSYSTVYLATDRQTLKEYAIKVLDKKHIIKEKKIKYVNIEKNTLNRLTDHPGIVRLYYTFQDETSLYYVLDLCTGGELLGVLKKTGTFDEECTRFYGAQILDAVDYMHSRGIIHRDLKPENVLLDDQMHIKITDFGTAKQLRDPREPGAGADPDNGGGGSSGPGTDADDDGRAASFVGTAEYVSPELLTSKNACKASDLWAFGCIVYQLLVGRPPFKAGTEYLTFQKIVGLDYDFPAGFPPAGRDLVERCLVLDPARRLTIEHIKNHAFFKGQPFGKVLWRTKSPRLRPYVPPPTPSDGAAAASGTIAQQQQQDQQQSSRPPNPSTSAGPPPPNSSNGSTRPSRIITELPPPSQLDLEWSPVLTRTNERILKLGDLLVISSPLPTSPQGKGSDHGDGHKKLARFFGGSTTKKRQRLVVVTSAGRILLAPAGGEEKRAKQEISLTAADCSWKSQVDVKGLKVWCVDVAGMHYTFEEPKPSSSATASANDTPPPTAEEWIESLEKSKDLAISQSLGGSDNGFSDMPSAVSSPSSTLTGRGGYSEGYGSGAGDRPSRTHLTKNQLSEEAKKNRFSKRHSKNGLGSAF